MVKINKIEVVITIQTVISENREAVRRGLKESGFMSAAEIYNKSDEDLLKLIGIKRSWLPKSRDLRKVARQEGKRSLRCYCLEYTGNVKSYWYNVDDLKVLYCPFPYSQAIGESSVAWTHEEAHGDNSTFISSIDPYNENLSGGRSKGAYLGFSSGINPVDEDRPCWIVRVWNKIFKINK